MTESEVTRESLEALGAGSVTAKGREFAMVQSSDQAPSWLAYKIVGRHGPDGGFVEIHGGLTLQAAINVAGKLPSPIPDGGGEELSIAEATLEDVLAAVKRAEASPLP